MYLFQEKGEKSEMKDMRSEKAEEILQKLKKRDRKASIPYQGPADIDFIVQKTTEGTDDKTQEKISRVLRELDASTMDDVGPLTTLSGITSSYR
jgi:hypothetical protein